MLTTFDRYLLGRLMHTFFVLFIAAYGLYIVIDLFTNIDEFQDNTTTSAELFLRIGQFYAIRAFEFFSLGGTPLIVISVITVLGLVRKHSESFPILAAGVPAFRLLRPMLLAAIILNGGLIANQESIIPRIAAQLQTPRGNQPEKVQKVEPVYDYSNYLMHIHAERVEVDSQTLIDAAFMLPEPELSESFCGLRAEKAIFADASGKRPSGWLLQNLTGVFDPKILTPEGRRRVIPAKNGRDVFIISEVSFDQLYNRGRNFRFLSSLQLIHRIRNPATGPVPVPGQSITLHSRLTQPLLCMLNIAIALPLVFRRESHSLITNLAVCAGVLGFFYAVAEGCLALGSSGLIAPDLAAWLPVIITGVASTWTSGLVQT